MSFVFFLWIKLVFCRRGSCLVDGTTKPMSACGPREDLSRRQRNSSGSMLIYFHMMVSVVRSCAVYNEYECCELWKRSKWFYFISMMICTADERGRRWKQRRNLKVNRIDESNRYEYFTWLWTGEISSWMTNVTALHSCTDFRSVVGGASERAEQCWAYLRFGFTCSLIF